MSRQRVNSTGKKKNDEFCIRYTQREEWVKYLTSIRNKTTQKFSEEKLKSIEKTYKATKNKKDMNIKELTERIFNSINTPNFKQKNDIIAFDM